MDDNELNERVAKALGNLPCEVFSFQRNGDKVFCKMCGAQVDLDKPEHTKQANYSTDIRAAWEIVEHVQKTKPLWRFVFLGGDKQFNRMFHVEWFEVKRGWPRLGAYADTAPKAICLAFLKLKDKEKAS